MSSSRRNTGGAASQGKSAGAGPDSVASPRSRAAAAEKARIGAAAEAMAAAYFEMHGCEVIGRNLHVGGGEIDLVVTRGSWMLLVEVRCRSGDAYGSPAETVRGRKARALGRAARALLSGGAEQATCWRFDVVTVVRRAQGVRLDHYPGAVSIEGGRS